MNEPKTELVKVYDPAACTVSMIPVAELAPGMIRIRFGGSDEILWVDAAQLDFVDNEPYHPPFTGARCGKVLYIQKALREAYPKNYEDWEDGFRRDLHVDQELDLWVRVARALNEFAARHHPTPDERREAFEILGACLNTTPTTVFETVSIRLLSRTVAQELVDFFFNDHR